ncbi:AI-2E family transporter [Patescibacteria group bacterium]|nr:AI-2E family transporter [Patescibacteria group bacterium]
MEQSRIHNYFFSVLFVLALVLNFFVFQPYLAILGVALTFAVIFFPLYKWVHKRFVNHDLSAFLATVVVFLIFIVPIVFWSQQIFLEARGLYQAYTADSSSNVLVNSIVHYFRGTRAGNVSGLSLDLNQYLRNIFDSIANNLSGLFSSVVNLILAFALFMVSLFFFFRDGDKLRSAVIRLVPLPEKASRAILAKMHLAINSVIRGQIAVAIAQAILTIIGFTIFGIPNPVLWGSMALFASLVPTLGTSLVLVPAILYLYFVGDTGQAIGLLIWAVLAIGTIDNILGPYVINRGVKIHSLVILLAVLGGVKFFGPIGFLLGPLMLSFMVALFEAREHLTAKGA